MNLSPEMIQYIDSMPDIYKDVFRAFPKADPGRPRGSAQLVGPLTYFMRDINPKEAATYTSDRVDRACKLLLRYKFFQRGFRKGVYKPTPLGEDAIEYLTNVTAINLPLPALDPPPKLSKS